MKTIELLESAASAAAPPAEYWTRYSARLRQRLDTEVLCRGGLQPTGFPTLRRAEARLQTAAIAAAIAIALVGTLYLGWRKSDAPVIVARTEKLPPRPFVGPRPPFAAPLLPSRGARPERPPQRPKTPRPESPVLPPSRVVAIAPEAIQAAPREIAQAGENVLSEPLALRLTDYRLLRNGVEIARGELIETPADGVLWFADRKGDRFIISFREERGAQPVTARGGSIIFTWKHDRFEWLSSTPIVETERQLWVSHHRIAPELDVPRPKLAWPAWPIPRGGARGRLGAERERPLDFTDSGEDGGQHVRVGVAKSVVDLLRNKRLH